MFRHIEHFAIAPESIGFLPVLGVVTDKKVFISHAERHHKLDDIEDDTRHYHVPCCDEESANDLFSELLTPNATVESTPLTQDGEEIVAEGGLSKASHKKTAH